VQGLDKKCRALALDIMSEVLFAKSWHALDDYSKEGNPAAWALAEAMYVLHWRIVDFADARWRQNRYHGAEAILGILEGRVDQEIATHRRQLTSGSAPDDLLSFLLQRQPQLTTEELQGCCLTLLTMGHENVGSAMAWTLLLLASQPTLQDEVREEIRTAIVGQAVWSLELLDRLPKLTASFEEAIRLSPSVPAATRTPKNPDGAVVLGYHIPQGEELALNLYSVQRLEDNPCVLPFATGARMCVGRALAYLEARVLASTLLPEMELAPISTSTKEFAGANPRVFVSLRPHEAQVRVSKL